MGLPFPKELAPLGPGRVVIDSCLDLVGKAREKRDVRILLLEDGTREQTIRYIQAKLPDIPVAHVRQNPLITDFGSAVLSLEPWFSEINVIMLPDGVYDAAWDPVGELAAAVFRKDFAFAAAALPPEDITCLGGLEISGGRVKSYQEKPKDPSRFNAAWTMIGFSDLLGGIKGLELVRLAMGCGEVIQSPPVLDCPVVWVNGYRDCGTWGNYLQARRADGNPDGHGPHEGTPGTL